MSWRDDYKNKFPTYIKTDIVKYLEAIADTFEAEHKQMMEYVQHKEDCIFSKYPFTDVGCSCGLTDLLNKIKGDK